MKSINAPSNSRLSSYFPDEDVRGLALCLDTRKWREMEGRDTDALNRALALARAKD